MKDKTKLIVFDMEGTIFKNEFKGINEDSAHTAWEMISNYLGEEAIIFQNETYNQWQNDKISYMTWMEETAKMHKEENLDYSFYNKIINYIPYRNGFDEFMSKVNNKNIKTAIITGGLKSQAERVKKDYNIDYIFASGEYYWNDDGYIRNWNILPTGHYGKPLCVKQLAQSLNINTENICFVGDGKNDIPVVEYVQGKTFAINGCRELNEKSDIQINMNNTDNAYDIIYDEIFTN